jgi:alcohol dehydrogenase (cytochrome c)
VPVFWTTAVLGSRREDAAGIWSFNTGTGVNAPPITYSVDGKQYVAVLVGSKKSQNIIWLSPELKNSSTASMLYVFGL